MEKFEFRLYRPGIAGFGKHGEPYGYEPEITQFEANSGTEALNIATDMYKQTGLGSQGHFGVGLAS